MRYQRSRRRVRALVDWGYQVPPRGGPAPAGDTVEIVEVLTSRGRSGVAGLRVRATARLCAESLNDAAGPRAIAPSGTSSLATADASQVLRQPFRRTARSR